jgi:hypothetical protein
LARGEQEGQTEEERDVMKGKVIPATEQRTSERKLAFLLDGKDMRGAWTAPSAREN